MHSIKIQCVDIWKLNNAFQKKKIKEEITRKVRKYLELQTEKYIKVIGMQLRKCSERNVQLSTYIKNEERPHIKNPTIHLRNQKKNSILNLNLAEVKTLIKLECKQRTEKFNKMKRLRKSTNHQTDVEIKKRERRHNMLKLTMKEGHHY